ncbi:Hypothetical protein AA314_02199 [Archangium gephyra]|uniref:Uncharacterized protein n=1 Tax=Archangium gephyra TaxID=48 RepID=A0AAC8Q3S7_9BACT|nr:Hypothetical protein AA314_02199 [Archangium gephyra]
MTGDGSHYLVSAVTTRIARPPRAPFTCGNTRDWRPWHRRSAEDATHRWLQQP